MLILTKAERAFSNKKHISIFTLCMHAACSQHTICKKSVVRIEGLRGVSRGREVGGAYILRKKKETPQIIGLKWVWFKLRLFDSRFCTRSHVAVHSGPPQSLEVRKAAEKQPACQSIWTDIGKWFPMTNGTHYKPCTQPLKKTSKGSRLGKLQREETHPVTLLGSHTLQHIA